MTFLQQLSHNLDSNSTVEKSRHNCKWSTECHFLHWLCDLHSFPGSCSGILSFIWVSTCGFVHLTCVSQYWLLFWYRNTLLLSVNNFIHLNLSISLLISYIIFVVGIETATSSLVRHVTFISFSCKYLVCFWHKHCLHKNTLARVFPLQKYPKMVYD